VEVPSASNPGPEVTSTFAGIGSAFRSVPRFPFDFHVGLKEGGAEDFQGFQVSLRSLLVSFIRLSCLSVSSTSDVIGS
jgi:hypothetical protein